MTPETADQLRGRLRAMGLSDSAISAAWPRWWSSEADASTSARTELRFSLARNLGLDPRSLFDVRERPRFVWHRQARFKHLTTEGDTERDAIASFGKALGSLLVTAADGPVSPLGGESAGHLREAILASQVPYVRLVDLLALSWSVGIPVVHLRVFPWPQKRMAAMSVRVDSRSAVLLAKDSEFPAQIAFYLAHELGHIVLNHLETEPVIVDLEQDNPIIDGQDAEEADADRFALELLTGESRPAIMSATTERSSARELARVALNSAAELKIEPGTLAFCFGYSTQQWATANAAMKQIYAEPKPVWSEVNGVAKMHLRREQLPQDAGDYLDSVLEPQLT